MATLKLSRDTYGNKILIYSPGAGRRGFSVQTLGNLPEVHRMTPEDINNQQAMNELHAYIKKYGTKHQKDLLTNFN